MHPLHPGWVVMVRALPILSPDRPRTRGDCENAPRPCPWVECRHFLASEYESCVLDVAARGGSDVSEIAALMELTVEQVNAVLTQGVTKMQTMLGVAAMSIEIPDEWANAKEAITFLGCSRPNLYRLVDLGRIRKRKDSRGVVFSREDLRRERATLRRVSGDIVERMKAVHARFSSPLFATVMRDVVKGGDVHKIRGAAMYYFTQEKFNLEGIEIVVELPAPGQARFNVRMAEEWVLVHG